MRAATVVEIVLTYISIGWAYVLFTTPSLFEQSPNWNQIKEIANYEWVLAICALICATVKVLGIAFHSRITRYIGLIMSAILWIMVSAAFLVSDGDFKLTTGCITYSGMAVLALWTSKEVWANGRND